MLAAMAAVFEGFPFPIAWEPGTLVMSYIFLSFEQIQWEEHAQSISFLLFLLFRAGMLLKKGEALL